MNVPGDTVRCVTPCSNELGEGPCWSPAEGRLYWFDIKGRRLSWLEPATGATGGWPLPVRASGGAPRARGGLIVATEAGLGHVDTRTGDFDLIEPVRLPPGHRSNEAGIDVRGRFWWSEMDDAAEEPGAVYLKLPGRRSERVLEEITIPNTLEASADGERLYVADSAARTMRTFRIDSATGALSDEQPFFDLSNQAAGVPDGSALDAEGFLWNAQWGAWRVVRYSPEGKVDRIIETPVEQPSSCAFGGPHLETLYITSARCDLSDHALAGQTLAGGLFAIEPGVRGCPLPAFEG